MGPWQPPDGPENWLKVGHWGFRVMQSFSFCKLQTAISISYTVFRASGESSR